MVDTNRVVTVKGNCDYLSGIMGLTCFLNAEPDAESL